jgi:F0F1-type ATP synthase assembly protein I
MRPGGDVPSGRELAGLGIFLAASLLIPLVTGLLLDRTFHTSPVLAALGLVLGVVAATLGFYVRFKRYL